MSDVKLWPSVGRIVHYGGTATDGGLRWLPAIVTDTYRDGGIRADLNVFDGKGGMYLAPEVARSDEPTIGRWWWSPRDTPQPVTQP